MRDKAGVLDYTATFLISTMAISIRNPEAERKLRHVARMVGKTMTATVIELADGKLKELEARKDRFNARPVLDDRSADEILGYNKDGLFD